MRVFIPDVYGQLHMMNQQCKKLKLFLYTSFYKLSWLFLGNKALKGKTRADHNQFFLFTWQLY